MLEPFALPNGSSIDAVAIAAVGVILVFGNFTHNHCAISREISKPYPLMSGSNTGVQTTVIRRFDRAFIKTA